MPVLAAVVLVLASLVPSPASGVGTPAAAAPAPDPIEQQLQRCAALARNDARAALGIAEAVLAERAIAVGVQLRALACRGIAQAVLAQPADALATADRMVEILDKDPVVAGEAAYALGQAGGIFQTLGQTDRAAVLYQRGYELTRKDGSPRAEMLALLNIAGLHAGALNDPATGDAFFRRAVDIAARNNLETGYIYFNYGLNLSRLNRQDEALAALDRAAELAKKAGNQEGVRFRADAVRAEIFMARGELAAARTLLEQSLAGQRALPDKQGEVSTLRRLSVLQVREGRAQDAVATALASLRLAQEAKFPEDETSALQQVSDAYAALGKPVEARAYAERRLQHELTALRQQNLASIAALQAGVQNAVDARKVERLQFDAQVAQWRAERERWARDAAIGAFIAVLGVAALIVGLQVRANRRLLALSSTDSLTGLVNRRAGVSRLTTLSTAGSGRHVLYLVDADHFKAINDASGHTAGDEVLVELARRLHACCRADDLVARWGGEEFLIAGLQPGHEEAQAFAERVRAAVAAQPVVLGDGRAVRLTVSLGFAPLPFYSDGVPDDWHGVIDVADRALYAAKHAGRDAWAGVWGLDRGAHTDDTAAPAGVPHDIAAAHARGHVALSASRSAVWDHAAVVQPPLL
jgi:diguanylate cyclase (GGDEF)-like protein